VLVKDLRVNHYYSYRGKFVVNYVCPFANASPPVWRFVFLTDEIPKWIDILEEEVGADIEPLNPFLDQYLTLFDIESGI